ncbi:IS110 family transposase [Brevibacterium spongiae]|uniref:IS110 family transposase n=1 Tax=Brevibacterium spongiae TaxID=2909672 RepID=A0ABY5SRI5_9MICO|nr:IS110 family transposase [Brevibacterium spongiae]UVI36521.1 IS110 family transposase [Brevibacterium spongiae]UVI36591.1 IS110 family transposase [Brevibacterium spongiae]
MSIISHLYAFVVGVDTHAKNHVYAVLTNTGEQVDTREFPTSKAGLARALDWVGRRTGGDQDTLWVIEGIGTYGAILAETVAETGYTVAEAASMSARDRHATGKDDRIDAYRVAHTVLSMDESRLRCPRQADGPRQGLRILVKARQSMTQEKTRTINALTGLLRANDLGIDARRKLSVAKIRTVAKWRARNEPVARVEARREAIRLAKRVIELDADIKDYATRILALVKDSPAAVLLEQPGIGAITAAVFYLAWSHPGRVHSEAAFAKLAGTNPIPASSGNVVRFRLNRSGDRQLNSALYMVAITKLSFDERTRAYMAKRLGEGKSKKETIRCIKRYVARNVYRLLEATSVRCEAA